MGGTIHGPGGIPIVNYAWELGSVSNTLAEVYSLRCGLGIAKETGIRELVVLGDSLLVIRATNEKRSPLGNKLNAILKSIDRISKNFELIRLVHIKRELNVEADLWAKHARYLPQGSLRKNDMQIFLHIP
jgi:ribonuclease HI